MTDLIQCPLCSNNQQPPILYHNVLRYSHPGSVYKCPQCEFIFLYPRLTFEDHNNYYKINYRDDYQDNEIQERFIYDQTEASLRLKKITSHFPTATSLLEIGAGSGAFLSLATLQFDKAIGIELDANAQLFMNKKNLNIYSNLDDIPDEKFDLIVMFHVLEHLLDPVSFLSQLSLKLTPNGSIIIEVPNVEDALLSFYNIEEFKNFYFCSAHVSYFSDKTLLNCIQKAGLKGEVFFTQRYDLHNHLHWLLNKKPGTFSEDQQIFKDATLTSYQENLASKGFSDTLWATSTKQS